MNNPNGPIKYVIKSGKIINNLLIANFCESLTIQPPTKRLIQIKCVQNIIRKILSEIGVRSLDDIKEDSVKEMLKNLTSDAFEKDIFGAPTFVVNNKIFWGQDRLDYALDEYNF